MEGAEKGEMHEKESPPLRIDPKCFQDALKAFFQPIETGDPRLDFYTMYKREATEYDTNYVKKCYDDLNTALIFAGFFAVINTAFVLDVHPKLQPNLDDQSVALLRAILLTLNQSTVPVLPPVQENPQSGIVTATVLMYASLQISMLVAFLAMLGKQWLNRYLRSSGGSMIERCGDRQRKFNGLEKWLFHVLIESLMVTLQAALLLLGCGLGRYMWTINTSVAYVIISITAFGVLFYLVILIAGTSSYACPFQTPLSVLLRTRFGGLRRGISSLISHSKQGLSWTRRIWNRGIRPLLRQSPPMILLGNIQVQQPEPWLGQKDHLAVLKTNTNDVWCLSWILRSITDPEALNAAVQLAGMVRWFEDGTDPEFAYDLVVSVFHACFDSNGKVYPGSRDRAYYSGRAIMWIHTLATCKSPETAQRFPLPVCSYTAPASDHDLAHLLAISKHRDPNVRFQYLFDTDSEHTPSHSRWISNVLLHHSWANQTTMDLEWIQQHSYERGDIATPPDVTLNRLLVWCILLGSPIDEGALKVQDKSDHLERILRQLSGAIISAINTAQPQRDLVPYAVRELVKLETRPQYLTEMAYEWCSVICANRISGGRESLLLDSLEIGFRQLDSRFPRVADLHLTHTEHHRGLIDVIFKSDDGEAIADLLHAWTTESQHQEPAYTLLGACAEHLVNLHSLAPFSSRLRRLVIRSVELIGYKGFEEVGADRFVELLDHLHVGVEDMDSRSAWMLLLLDTIQSPGGVQYLSNQSWELLVELTISEPRRANRVTYSPHVMSSLFEAQEWDKLECWIGVVWMTWPPETKEAAKDLERAMVSLFRHRPGAAQKLTRWMERLDREEGGPEYFERTCKRAHGAAQRDISSTSSPNDGTE